jgi:hypothetical protein
MCVPPDRKPRIKSKDALIDMARIELCQTAATAALERCVFAYPQTAPKPEIRCDKSQIRY